LIYYIDESCVKVLSEGNRDAAELLEQLVMNRRKCKNILLAPRNVLGALSQSENLSKFAREYYRILMNRSGEYKLILNKAKKYYRVVAGYIGDKRIIEDGQECILLSVEEGNQTDLSERTILLVESDDDIEFYSIVGKYYLQYKGIDNMQIAFDSEIGGGDTTASRLSRIVDEGKRTCLCIVDSDKKYYGAVSGDTLKK
jgi:hypothetical protein